MFPRLGTGLGLRPPFHAAAAAGDVAVDWFELISENLMVAGGNPRQVARAVRERYPVVLHGVSLSIGSIDPLDGAYLAALAALCDELEPALVSDHLCWSSLGGHTVHDLWPVPYTEEALVHVAARVAHVQDRLGRRILLENPSSYAVFATGELGEAEFLAELVRRADCGILLDVNNLWVSCANHGWDADAYLRALPADRIGQLHLAGHTVEDALYIDTHDQPVSDGVWTLYAEAVRRFGAVSTCLERDDRIPPIADLVAEAAIAAAVANSARAA